MAMLQAGMMMINIDVRAGGLRTTCGARSSLNNMTPFL